MIWNLRGHAVPLDKLTPIIVEKIRHCGKVISAVIIDPIYKVREREENDQDWNEYNDISVEDFRSGGKRGAIIME